ncbi:MAG: ammonia-dependent NAD(+) synthetase [Candidatus Thorarchaeota archaeon]
MDYNPRDEIARELVPIDVAQTSRDLTSSANKYIEIKNKNGVLVPISGGLDSTAVIVGVAHALRQKGRGLLRLLYMPSNTTENQTKKRVSDVYIHSREIYPNTVLREIPIGEELEQDRAYKESLELQQGYLRNGAKLTGETPMALRVMRQEFGEEGAKASAFIGKTTRLRGKYALEQSLKNNLALASCGNKTEHELGLFFPGAVDDIGDFRPIEHLYKTQIRQLHKMMPFPLSIMQRVPTPDIGECAGTDEEYFGIPYPLLDAVLYREEGGMSRKDIASAIRPFYHLFSDYIRSLRDGNNIPLEQIIDEVLEMKELARKFKRK